MSWSGLGEVHNCCVQDRLYHACNIPFGAADGELTEKYHARTSRFISSSGWHQWLASPVGWILVLLIIDSKHGRRLVEGEGDA